MDNKPGNAIKAEILEYVLRSFDVTLEALRSPSREGVLVDARGCYIYLCRRLLDTNYVVLGWDLDRHHATAIHGFIRLRNLLEIGDTRVTPVIDHFFKTKKYRT